MYSERTQEEILESMKESVRDDVDKREGSVVHDMLAPPAQEIEMLGFELDAILELGFADTSQVEYLERRTAELGIFRKSALPASGTVTFIGNEGTPINAGTRILTDEGVPFVTTEYTVITNGVANVTVEAEWLGAIGNIGPSEIFTIEGDPVGLQSVTNTLTFTGGVDEETDEELKARYFLKVRKPITSGNKYHYELWATEVEGVSAAKVHPLWNGNGTVKVVVIDSNGRAPSQTIIDAVITHIEDDERKPIGATVTVVPVTEVPLNISASLTLEGNLLIADVQQAVEESISRYLLEAGSFVRYSQIANAIIDTDGVLDYANLTVNLGTANIPIDGDSVPVIGMVTLT
ncbi:baseplate J/gp47 family protein [Metabacillus fastidiosus]|uniref:Baseplate J/gp47 family protein n=1 Tax=Metabacillus fastidiosus TaxID=1458 RepID=A0ABU6NRI4_9BACI|nr:baseplate J/gp47 family protein [Metabacillus fastidiosus]